MLGLTSLGAGIDYNWYSKYLLSYIYISSYLVIYMSVSYAKISEILVRFTDKVVSLKAEVSSLKEIELNLTKDKAILSSQNAELAANDASDATEIAFLKQASEKAISDLAVLQEAFETFKKEDEQEDALLNQQLQDLLASLDSGESL